MKDIQTKRLIFRQWQESDLEDLAEFFSDINSCKYVGGIKTKEESYRLMTSYIGHYQLKGYSYVAVIKKSDKELIGSVGLWNSTQWPELELGYWFFPKHQGKGYATEAADATKRWAFENLNIDTLVSYISTENHSSINLSKRLGGRFENNISVLEYGPHDVYRYSH